MPDRSTIGKTAFRRVYKKPGLRWAVVVLGLLQLVVSCRPSLSTTSPRYLPEGKYLIKEGRSIKKASVFNYNDTAFLLLDSGRTLIAAGRYLDTHIESAFLNTALGIDLITVPVKLRPALGGIPQQLNTTFNAALAAGFRRDKYTYKKVSLAPGIQKRNRYHSGYGANLFLGTGAVLVRRAFIQNALEYDYDGLVVYYGGSLVLGLGGFNIGIGLGFDLLTDKNRKRWIYQNEPWIGAALGIKL